jgi:putative hydroxymethylpyrimidine transport system permease protein
MLTEREELAQPPARARALWRRQSLHGLRSYVPAIVLIVVAVGIWELMIRALDVPEYLWPAPSVVAKTVASEGHLILTAIGVTVREIVFGYLISVAAGLAIGSALHFSRTVRRAIYPILIASQSIPTVVIAPILAIVLGFGIGPKLAVIALFCFFPIVVNTVDGLGAVDRDYIRMMQTLHGSRLDIFRKVEFPSALPLIFSGCRIAATYAAIGAVFGEWTGAEAGLGYEITQAQPRLNTPLVFALVMVLTVLALILFGLVSLVERLTIPWARRREQSA